MATTLIQDLLQTVDDARQISTDLGARLYRVFARTRTWTGATQGAGTFTDVDTELLPRPRVRAQMPNEDFEPLLQAYSNAGLHWEGKIKIDKISAQIPLAVLNPTLAENQRQFFIVLGADGGEVIGGLIGALFVADGAPFRNTLDFEMVLLKVDS